MGLYSGDMEGGRFVLMTGWPSFPAMGKAFGNFFTDGAGDEVMVEWAATATCETRNLYTVEELQTPESISRSPQTVPQCGAGAFLGIDSHHGLIGEHFPVLKMASAS